MSLFNLDLMEDHSNVAAWWGKRGGERGLKQKLHYIFVQPCFMVCKYSITKARSTGRVKKRFKLVGVYTLV